MRDADDLSGLRVLLVEEQAIVALWLIAELGDAGLRVWGPARGCAEGLALLARITPDLVVLDPGLRDGSATEFAAELHARGVPFVVFTGSREPHAGLGREARPVTTVHKPATGPGLLDGLRAARRALAGELALPRTAYRASAAPA